MKALSQRKVQFWGFAVTLLGALTLAAASLSQRTDFIIEVNRESHSNTAPEKLAQAIEVLPNWKRWFRGVADAKAVDFRGVEYPLRDQKVMKGSAIRLKFKTGGELLVEVLDYVPGKRIVIGVIEDSTGVFKAVLWPIEWTIELHPIEGQGGGTRITGKLRTKTASWKTRLLASVFPSMVGMQVFLPDLVPLALITQPDQTNPHPDWGQ